MSGVERLTFADGTTAIFKYAKKPFDSEDQALRLAAPLGVPVPAVHASAVVDGWLGMLLEDLGPAAREADDLDGATAAVVLHRTRTAAALPVLDQEGLARLPSRALEHLGQLRKAERWQDTDDIEDALDRTAQAAEARSAGTTVAPFGWVHSEFHPTSLHIGHTAGGCWTSPAPSPAPACSTSPAGTAPSTPPTPYACASSWSTYVTEGGTPDALAERGGLPAEKWALGWHRMWAVEWFMEQSIRWINDPATDPAYINAVRRHLTDVLHLLEV